MLKRWVVCLSMVGSILLFQGAVCGVESNVDSNGDVIPPTLFPPIALVYCVDPGGGGTTYPNLNVAFFYAQSNNANTVIRMVQGHYTGTFKYTSTEGRSITLAGGYTAGCADRKLDPANTILDGNNIYTVLHLSDSSGGAITVDGFTVRNGNAFFGGGGGIYARSYSLNNDPAGNISLRNNIIEGNTAVGNGGGLSLYRCRE